MIGCGSGRQTLTVAAVLILWSAAVPAARPDGGTPRYFDSERGRDLGACTADAPCRTLARYRSVARRGDPMVLVDGSVFREEIPMVGPTAISRSGTGWGRALPRPAPNLVARPWTADGRNLSGTWNGFQTIQWSFSTTARSVTAARSDGGPASSRRMSSGRSGTTIGTPGRSGSTSIPSVIRRRSPPSWSTECGSAMRTSSLWTTCLSMGWRSTARADATSASSRIALAGQLSKTSTS